MWFVWNGSNWLSAAQYTEPIGYASAQSATGDLTADRLAGDIYAADGLYVEGWEYSFYVTGGTALSASHKWVVTLKSFVGNVGTARMDVTIDSGASDVWRTLAGTGGPAVLNGIDMYQVTATKTGTPGDLHGIGRMTYRRRAT